MKKLLIYLLPVVFLASCAKNLDDYNVDQKNPDKVTASSLFANALKELTDNVTTPDVNINVFRFWVQQWTATTYQDEPRYDMITRSIPIKYWTPMYVEVLHDFKESKRITEADPLLSAKVKANRIAAVEIASVYAWSVVVNCWGDVPYSEALGTIGKPKYDKAADIYTDLFKRLDAAIAAIDPGSDSFGSSDLLYDGNAASWLKFAHSLKLKLAINVADVNDATARSIILASADKAFTSNADNASFRYLSSTPNNNPVSKSLNPTYTSRQDYVASEAIIKMMNDTQDPRRPFFFTNVKGDYIGGEAGSNNTFDAFSQASKKVIAPDFEALLLDYAEVEFILAEASERWGILGSPTDHYNKGITASVLYWGGTQAQADAYLTGPNVAYATAAGNFKQKIGEQKYLALYNRGYDAWTEWRRLDYPVLKKASQATLDMPLRLFYPSSERTLNQENVEKASASMGGDVVTTKLFWDKF